MNSLHIRRAALALLALGAASLAACADAPTAAPAAEGFTPRLGVVGKVAQRTVGDTTVTSFTLAPGRLPTPVHLGNDNKIDIPDGASSICDIARSSYGPGEWDKPCTPSTSNVRITAKTWVDAKGLTQTDFQPALRFVPNDARPVVLHLRNRDGYLTKSMRIDFCHAGVCMDEARLDPSVATQRDQKNRTAHRRIKHFSGYMVTVGATDAGSDSTQTGETW